MYILVLALNDGIGSGVGFFHEGGTKRSLAFGRIDNGDGYVMVDVNADGNFTGGTDMIFLMYGSAAELKLTDFIWG